MNLSTKTEKTKKTKKTEKTEKTEKTGNKNKLKIPKKRGRKPKPKDPNQPPKIPKKRGRKPKPKDPNQPPKIPKKRGRKPKEKSYGLHKKKQIQIESENVILHLPINYKTVIQNSKEAELLTYNPNIKTPEAWQVDTLGGNPIDNVVFLQETTVDNKNYMPKAINHNQYSHYPFDEKLDENDIIDSLGDLESNDCTENENDIYNNMIKQNNIVQNIHIDHLNNWYQENTKLNQQNLMKDNCEEIINKITNKRKKDLESFSNIIINNSVESMLIQFKEANKTRYWPDSTSIYCWWCCHPFDGPPCGLPCKCVNDQFNVYGIFCSPECAAAYNFDNNTFNEMWEIYSLLNLLYRKVYNDKNIKIKLAAPKETLKIFGGSLSIKDFRMYNTNYSREFNIIKPPMISIIPQQEFKCVQNLNTSKKNLSISNFSEKDLRLKRSKPYIGSKNTLEKCMNLKCKK